jgi:endonuclease/exonuclease/phosphatase family metal-dependent hydrolase
MARTFPSLPDPQTILDIRVVTYNIHRCCGMDRRVMPRRIADVLSSLNPDVIALQEVLGPGSKGRGQDEFLGALLGMGWVMAPARLRRGHPFGNMILSRFPIVNDAQHDLTWRTRRGRCCQRADLRLGDQTLHVYNVHFGTGLRERQYQAERLAMILDHHHGAGPKIILGDFNEWGRGVTTDILTPRFHSLDIRPFVKRRRTYPGFLPLLHLDHIFYEGGIDVSHVHLPKTRAALVASDHLPLVADLRICF